MPETIAMLVWIVGGAVIVMLLSIVAFFIHRLISGIDDFKKDVTGALQGLTNSVSNIREDLAEQVGGLNTRVTVLEEAGCEPCRERLKNG
jgi:5-bromo-4-chloroindolyl phosphate hydrolysis protein